MVIDFLKPILKPIIELVKKIYNSNWDANKYIVFIFIMIILAVLVLTYILSSMNMKNTLMGGKLNNETTFTLYYVDWCPHCKVVKPEWTKLENDNELEHIIFVKIDCEENEDIVKEKNIEGFPTILLTHNGKEMGYNGGREYADFKNYLLNL